MDENGGVDVELSTDATEDYEFFCCGGESMVDDAVDGDNPLTGSTSMEVSFDTPTNDRIIGVTADFMDERR
jgi:hypothetical protein